MTGDGRRVAYVCADPGIPVFGCKGASVHVQEVIRALRRAGAEVHLHAARRGGEAPPDLVDLPLSLIPALHPAWAPPPTARTDDATARARRALRANRPLHDALAQAGRFDLVYERYSLWSMAGMAYARGAGACAGLLEVNAPLIDEQAAWRELALPHHARRVARFAFRRADTLLAVSPGVANWLETFPCARGRIAVVANGVDAQRFDAVAAGRQRAAADGALTVGSTTTGSITRPITDESIVNASATAGPITIGFVGTLKPWHGLPILIDGWARLRASGIAARLLLVGDGPERGRIEADIRARGLTAHAELTGAVEPDRIPALLGRIDVGVAPYPAGEDFYFSPLKLYEYMAAGLPIVCSRVGHLADVIRDDVDGVLVQAGNAAALADALARLARDPGRRLRLGRAARARALAEHGWDAIATHILELADRAVEQRRRSA